MDKLEVVEEVIVEAIPKVVDIALVAVHVPEPVATLVHQLVQALWHLPPPEERKGR